MEIQRILGVPPSPPPLEGLDWRGFCKNALQNLERQRFTGQNPDNKGVSDSSAVSGCAASALIIICRLKTWVKVEDHKGLWKIVISDLVWLTGILNHRGHRGTPPLGRWRVLRLHLASLWILLTHLAASPACN